jgi:hypothetical protein
MSIKHPEKTYLFNCCRHYPDMTNWSHFNPEALSRLCLPQGLRFTNDRKRYPPAWHPFVLTKVRKLCTVPPVSAPGPEVHQRQGIPACLAPLRPD